MHPEIANLLKLQETELEIQRLNNRIELLPRQLAELEAKLNSTLQALETNKQGIAQTVLDKKKLEMMIQDLEQKNSKYRGQLTDVKTNDQYKALLHEIDFNDSQIRKIEDDILVLMERDDELRKDSKKLEQQLQSERALVEAEKKAAEAEVTKDRKALKDLHDSRGSTMQSVSEEVLSMYQRIVKARKGVALARVADESCQACHVRIRPHVISQVMSGDTILLCDSCNRILYWMPGAPYELRG